MPERGRVTRIKLRGEPSFGFVKKLSEVEEFLSPSDVLRFAGENPDTVVNLSEYFDVSKYEPPVRVSTEDCEVQDPRFPRYTDIENLRHYFNIFTPGESVVVTEKIHGQTLRFGILSDGDEKTFVAGSSRLQRRRPESCKSSAFWYLAENENVMSLLDSLSKRYSQVILYGESYGPGIQNLHYDANSRKFRLFDIMVDNKYLDNAELFVLAELHNVETVPVLYCGAYDFDLIADLAEKPSVLNRDQIKEGVVIKPLRERNNPKIGRVVLKYISNQYLFNGKVSDSTDV